MPRNPINIKDKHDRFYTKETIAKNCIDILIPYCQEDDLFVEPSAGSGSFYRQLSGNKLGIDISPKCKDVVSSSWLEYCVPQDCVVVGNPPFGTRDKLTRAFIQHSLSGAKIIAFILPATYRKETKQSIFPREWSLVHCSDIPPNSFIFNGNDYHVPCVFQIWIKSHPTNIRESIKTKVTTKDFSFTTKDNADWFVFGASPTKIINVDDVKPNNRGFYIKENIGGVRHTFQNINWKSKANSSVTNGAAWFSKQEIINIYEEMKDIIKVTYINN